MSKIKPLQCIETKQLCIMHEGTLNILFKICIYSVMILSEKVFFFLI